MQHLILIIRKSKNNRMELQGEAVPREWNFDNWLFWLKISSSFFMLLKGDFRIKILWNKLLDSGRGIVLLFWQFCSMFQIASLPDGFPVYSEVCKTWGACEILEHSIKTMHLEKWYNRGWKMWWQFVHRQITSEERNPRDYLNSIFEIWSTPDFHLFQQSCKIWSTPDYNFP